MKLKALGALFLTQLFFSACNSGAASDNSKVIASTKAGNLTVSLSSASGEIRHGENDLSLAFQDASGTNVDVGAASLRFHMPAMIGMAEMNNTATLVTTDNPGRYQAHVAIESAGTWEAIVIYQGPQGKGQARMTINAK